MTTRKETTASILARIDQRLEHIETCLERFDDHERRIRSLEVYKAWLVGVAAAISASVAGLVYWFKRDK